jgi:hypothetical protein
MPPLIFCEEVEDGKRTRWLEDGQQRYWSIYRYKQDKFHARTASGEEKLYSELSPDEMACFNWYQMPVLTYENASREDRLYMFQYLQNGVQLTSGQRFHAMQSMSPIVRYAIKTFLDGNDRVSKVFGFGTKPMKDNKSKTPLQNAMALAGGLALGPGFITTSYEILGPELSKDVPDTANTALEVLLNIYEVVQTKSAWSNSERKKYQWPVGKITGYILWSILECARMEGDMDALSAAWVSFLQDLRGKRNVINILHKHKPSSRNWTSERWRKGFENIFTGGPAAAAFNTDALSETGSEQLDTSSSDEED